MTPNFAKRHFSTLIILCLLLCSILTSFNVKQLHPPNNQFEFKFAPGQLCALQINAQTFIELESDRYVLNYYLDLTNKYTLEGWRARGTWGHDYPERTFLLEPKDSACIDITPDTHFGNIILRNDDIKAIKRKIRTLENTSTVKNVLFIPGKTESKIQYKIYVQFDRGTKDIGILNEIEAVELDDYNPSPPKKY